MTATNGHNSLSLEHYVSTLQQSMEEEKAVSQAIRNLMTEASFHGLHALALKDVVGGR